MGLRSLLLSLALFGGLIFPNPSRAEWALQVGTGTAYSFRSPLEIQQDGEEDLNINAEYETRAWGTMAPYYNLRVGRWQGDRAWEFESLHHKLHLENAPDEIGQFAISHGYNINTVNYAVRWKGLVWRAGLGFVLAHPETEVRGKAKEDDGGLNGFYLGGAAVQAGLEKRFSLSERWYLSIEGKATAAYAEVDIADGTAKVPNYALHGIVGIGFLIP